MSAVTQTSLRPQRLRRTMLITPGNNRARLEKAATLDVDSVVIDFEDGVAPVDKAEARKIAADVLASTDFGHRERLIRVNAIGTAEFHDDIAALPINDIDALFVPKVERPEDLQSLDATLDEFEPRHPDHPINVIATIETPRGVLNALAIADASERTTALFFGSGDHAAATGSLTTTRAYEYPRATIVAAASAAGLQAIDAAYFAAVKDAEATRTDALLGRELGYDGKVVFHPAQLVPCNEVFSPSASEIAHAERIVKAHQDAVANGDGVAYVDGTFLAIDIVLMAQRVMDKGRLVEARQRATN